MVRLRGHHLFCILTFIGKGYSQEFVAHFERVVNRIRAGETVEIVEGPDEICCLGEATAFDAHCLTSQIRERDQLALDTVSQALKTPKPLHPGDQLDLQTFPSWIDQLRSTFSKIGPQMPPCQGCEWQPLCLKVVGEGFERSRL